MQADLLEHLVEYITPDYFSIYHIKSAPAAIYLRI